MSSTVPSFNAYLMCWQGSDIETLGSEVAVEYGAELLERSPEEETKLQETLVVSQSAGKDLHVYLFFRSLGGQLQIFL